MIYKTLLVELMEFLQEDSKSAYVYGLSLLARRTTRQKAEDILDVDIPERLWRRARDTRTNPDAPKSFSIQFCECHAAGVFAGGEHGGEQFTSCSPPCSPHLYAELEVNKGRT